MVEEKKKKIKTSRTGGRRERDIKKEMWGERSKKRVEKEKKEKK